MRPGLSLVALLLPCALAAQEAIPEPHFVRVRGFRNRVRLDTMIVWTSVNGSRDETFRNALAILEELSVPVGTADTVRGIIHHPGFVARTRLAAEAISRSFSCGRGPAGEYADTWRVNVAYVIYVQHEGNHSRVGIATVAGANDIEGASKPAVQCGRTGRLEHRMDLMLNERAPD
jgi:hypothetical protein